MKQETFLNTCEVFWGNLPLPFDEEYVVTKTHSFAPPFWLPKTLVPNHDHESRPGDDMILHGYTALESIHYCIVGAVQSC